MRNCAEALASHHKLQNRRRLSKEQLTTARAAFADSRFLSDLPISIFCAGSMARQEIGSKSDMDVFVMADDEIGEPSRLREYTLFAEVININRHLGLPPFSNDGQYLKIYPLSDIKRLTGSPKDDSENLFTARMLLLLESEPLLHDDRYRRHLHDVIAHYYRDNAGKKSFRPLFLLNDLLRYWRTLCLNYEETRHDSKRAWRKKNVNLKFSRMMTVFGTILPLIVKRPSSADELFEICCTTPLDRLAAAVDRLGDDALASRWVGILDSYESFLTWKEAEDAEVALKGDSMKDEVRVHADRLSGFLFDSLSHPSIPIEYRRYLVL
jgi:predicted nucleotidyltransferase